MNQPLSSPARFDRPAAQRGPTGTEEDPDAEIADVHPCPVCGQEVVRCRYTPGRARVYCTNACRQRAYRWRKANGVRLCVDRTGPTVRMINDKSHALRDGRDPVGSVRDARDREVAVCGAYAGRVRADRVSHTNFVPDHPFSCATCAELVGASEPYHGVPPHLRLIATFPTREEIRAGAPVGWGPWSIR